MLEGLAGDPQSIPSVPKFLHVFSVKPRGLTGEPKVGPMVTAESAGFLLMLTAVTGSLTATPITTPVAPGLIFGKSVSRGRVGNLTLRPVAKPGNANTSLLCLTLQLLCLLLPAKPLPKAVCLAEWMGGGVFSCSCCALAAMVAIDSLLLAAVLGLDMVAARGPGLSPVLRLLPALDLLSTCWQCDTLVSAGTLLGRLAAGLCCVHTHTHTHTHTQAKVLGRLVQLCIQCIQVNAYMSVYTDR